MTAQDCLKKVPNQFELVILGAKRARQLIKGERPLVESDNLEIIFGSHPQLNPAHGFWIATGDLR